MGKPEKIGMKKGPWTKEEDLKLLDYIKEHGHGGWQSLPHKAGLERCGKSCRLRWTNYLRPDIKRGKFSSHEEKAIIRLHALLGNRWSAIAAYVPKRTDNEIKNYWNTRLKKRLTRMGIDPTTHKPKNNPTLTHTTQWEAARLEAEARLASGSNSLLHPKTSTRSRLPSSMLPLLPCLDVLKVWQANTGGVAQESSPTSTLNFSASQSGPVAAVSTSSPVSNCVAIVASALNGIENASETLHQENEKYNPDCLVNIHEGCTAWSPMNNLSPGDACFEGFYDIGGPNGRGVEDTENNYWNEMLNLVGSPLESSLIF